MLTPYYNSTIIHTLQERDIMSKQGDTLDKAYGNIPKEVSFDDPFAWVPTYRGIKYYWYKFVRSFTR